MGKYRIITPTAAKLEAPIYIQTIAIDITIVIGRNKNSRTMYANFSTYLDQIISKNMLYINEFLLTMTK